MAYLLHIETATTLCSVAISNKDQLLVSRELDAGYTHAENLHLFIQEVLQQAGLSTKQLHAVAVSKGPGSYTGLRIGASAAKGLSYALSIPLIAIDTLQLIAAGAQKQVTEPGIFQPMIDARRMEVYTCRYDAALQAQSPVEALIVEENGLEKLNATLPVYFCGDGMPKCKTLLSQLPNARFVDDVKPSALNMVPLAYAKFLAQDFENTAYFEPFYLKDFMITKSKSKI